MRKNYFIVILLMSVFCIPLGGYAQNNNLIEKATIANQNYNFDEAFDYAWEAYNSNPEDPEMWLQMGIALQGLEENEDAKTCFERAINYAGDKKSLMAEAYLHIGEILGSEREDKEALKAINKGLELDKNNWHLYVEKAKLTIYHDKKKAKKDLSEAEKLAPDNAELFLEEASIYINADQWKDALAAINKAISLDKDNQDLYVTRGFILDQKGDLKSAAQDYVSSILLDDFDTPYAYMFLLHKWDKKDQDIIIKEIKQQAINNPQLLGALYILLEEWDREEAPEYYDELVKINDKATNQYFRIAKSVAEYYNNQEETYPFGYQNVTYIAIVEEDWAKNEVRDMVAPSNQNSNETLILREADSSNDISDFTKVPEIFTVVDEPAEFPGGMTALTNWLRQNIRYPEDAEMDEAEGRSLVRFVIEKDGSVSEVQIIRPNDPALDAEAIRVVQSMPKWEPGKQNGQPVRIYYTLPVAFKLTR